MQDTLAAVVQYLHDDAGIQAVFNDAVDVARVYGAELPQDQAEFMPRKAVVVRRSSGVAGIAGRTRLEVGFLTIVCWGETPEEAARLRGAVRDALRECIRRVVLQTLLHSFDPSSAPIQDRDAETDWPYVAEPWQFLASEIQAV
jgi:hypothetical protein